MAKRSKSVPAELQPIPPVDVSPFDSWLRTVVLASRADAEEAAKTYYAVCALYDRNDEFRKGLKQPFLRACQELDAQWRDVRKPLESLKGHLEALLADYAGEESRVAAKQAETATKKLKDKERAAALVRQAAEATPDLPYGTWLPKYELTVVDWRSVPEELLQLNTTEARKLCKQGARSIPGIEITKTWQRSARSPSTER